MSFLFLPFENRNSRGLMATGEAGPNRPCTPRGRAKRKDGACRCEGWGGSARDAQNKAVTGALNTLGENRGILIRRPGRDTTSYLSVGALGKPYAVNMDSELFSQSFGNQVRMFVDPWYRGPKEPIVYGTRWSERNRAKFRCLQQMRSDPICKAKIFASRHEPDGDIDGGYGYADARLG